MTRDKFGFHHLDNQVPPFKLDMIDTGMPPIRESNAYPDMFDDGSVHQATEGFLQEESYISPRSRQTGLGEDTGEREEIKIEMDDHPTNRNLINRIAQTKSNGDMCIDICSITRLKVKDFDSNKSKKYGTGVMTTIEELVDAEALTMLHTDRSRLNTLDNIRSHLKPNSRETLVLKQGTKYGLDRML